jgi:predicted metal-dependent phosphotriesterase family hydrolase
MSSVRTVLGPVAAESLGAVLTHEHLNPGTCWLRQARRGVRADDPVAILTAELRDLKANGIDTVVDVTTMLESIPRDLDLLCRA